MLLTFTSGQVQGTYEGIQGVATPSVADEEWLWP
jgi:hypothetical protein